MVFFLFKQLIIRTILTRLLIFGKLKLFFFLRQNKVKMTLGSSEMYTDYLVLAQKPEISCCFQRAIAVWQARKRQIYVTLLFDILPEFQAPVKMILYYMYILSILIHDIVPVNRSSLKKMSCITNV